MLSHVNLLHRQMMISRISRMVCYAIFHFISCKCKDIKTHRKLNISHSKVFPHLEIAKDVNPECEQMLPSYSFPAYTFQFLSMSNVTNFTDVNVKFYFTIQFLHRIYLKASDSNSGFSMSTLEGMKERKPVRCLKD